MPTTAADEETGGAGDEPQSSLIQRVFGWVLIVFFIGSLLALGCWGEVYHRHKDPHFSVSLTHVTGDLDPARSPVIRPEFGLTLRVDNHQIFRTCREEVAVTVFYGNTVVGWADVPDFCVDEWAVAELDVPLSHAYVALADGERRRLAAELRSGELELTVETRMVFSEGVDPDGIKGASRQSLLRCQVAPGQGYTSCRPLFMRDKLHFT